VIQITNEKYFARFFHFLKEIRGLLHKPQKKKAAPAQAGAAERQSKSFEEDGGAGGRGNFSKSFPFPL
jgi:hypothetical protein